jgi:FtsP/CotA-like multicopper oxidase with cupredoxin domain
MKSRTVDRRSLCRTILSGAICVIAGRSAWAEQEEQTLDIVARSEWLTGSGLRLYLSAYEGQVPGPVIRAKPGDHVKINFTNLLPDATNLHFHGLHIPSTGNADNSFLEVPRGSSVAYEFDIPKHHLGGTFWYHPHRHGRTARQLSLGLAGAFLVRGVLDEIPEIAGAPEQLLILQDPIVNNQGAPTEVGLVDQMQGREGDLILVSGRLNPMIMIQRNGWLRLRIVNASPSRFYRLQIDEHMLYQIASDGGALPAVQEMDEILLSPGERAEVMVSGLREPGEFRILNLPYDRGRLNMLGASSVRSASETIGLLKYEGNAESEWDLPQRLTTVEPLAEPPSRRRFELGEGFAKFTIDGRTFEPRRTDTTVRVNSIEEWEFDNPTGMDHPMHIHTNAFQVVGTDGQSIPAWKDVVLVRSLSRVRVRLRFDDYVGPTLYHCHILDHEDMGMMGRLDILPE